MKSTKSEDLIGHINFLPWRQLNGHSVTRPFLFAKGSACETNLCLNKRLTGDEASSQGVKVLEELGDTDPLCCTT